jgi:hypothetical protein
VALGSGALLEQPLRGLEEHTLPGRRIVGEQPLHNAQNLRIAVKGTDTQLDVNSGVNLFDGPVELLVGGDESGEKIPDVSGGVGKIVIMMMDWNMITTIKNRVRK